MLISLDYALSNVIRTRITEVDVRDASTNRSFTLGTDYVVVNSTGSQAPAAVSSRCNYPGSYQSYCLLPPLPFPYGPSAFRVLLLVNCAPGFGFMRFSGNFRGGDKHSFAGAGLDTSMVSSVMAVAGGAIVPGR